MNSDRMQSQETQSPLLYELLHAIAQPLTSLQMCILLRDQPSLDAQAISPFLHDMADQVTLLSRLFETLRRLLDTDSSPRITADQLERILPKILLRWHQAALERNIALLSTGVPAMAPTQQASSPGDPVETCLQDIVAAALESTPDRGSMTVTLVRQTDAVLCQLWIVGGTLLSEASFTGRFALPAAQTFLHSDDQEFTYHLNPFEAHLILHAPASRVAGAPGMLHPRSAAKDQAGFAG